MQKSLKEQILRLVPVANAYTRVSAGRYGMRVKWPWAIRPLSKDQKMKKLLLTAVISAITLPVFAQSSTPRLDARESEQQHRIAQGVRSGELTPKETRVLEKKEARLRHDEAKAKADGVVTPHERRKLEQEADRNSADIARLKHNDRVAH